MKFSNKDAEQTEGRICKMILEGGYECCSSITNVRELLSTVTEITEKEVAETIGCMARTHTNMTGVGNGTTNKDTTWRGQLSALYQMTNAPTDYVNLPACSKRKVMEVDDFSTANASNRTLATQLVKEQLNSLDLIECVIKMADTAVVDDVKVFLEMMVNKSPELVFMGLLQIDPLANKVHEDLFARLIVYYFTGNASSVFVFTKFWKAKPELFKKNILELYNNDPTALTRILAFVHELKILPAILDLQPFLFTIDLAALAARREYLNLEKWLQDKIKENGDVFCKACLAFLGSKIRAELTRQETQSAPITVPLSMDVVNVFIKVLAESNIDTSEKEILRDIQAGYLKINQKGPTVATTPVATAGVVPLVPEPALRKTPSKTPAPTANVVTFKQEIEDEANSYYEKIYSGEISIEGMIEKLRKFSQSRDPRENDIYACMIHNLLDEYNFFPKYPEKELTITSILFGQLIQHRLFTYATLGLALRYVLDALGHVPGTKIYRFGLTALTQFQSRLPEWPQYCFHLTQAPALQLTNPEIVNMIKQAMQVGRLQQQHMQQQPPQPNIMEGQPIPSLPSSSTGIPPEKLKSIVPQTAVFTAICVPDISKDKDESVMYETPNEATQDKILFIINNVAHNNLQTKSIDLKDVLQQSAYQWFSNYLVVKRASIEPNYHDLYLLLLKSVDSPLLYHHVLRETYSNIKILLNSDNTVSSSTERTLLKNLGSWLGGMTLAQNKPIKQKHISFKDLLLEGYDSSRLIVVIPFVCKVLEQGKKGKVFVPPNPWVMAILKLLVELYQNADLKLNLKFEIEVLCKILSIELNTIQPTMILNNRKPKKPQSQATAVVAKPESSPYAISRPPITNLISQSPVTTPAGLDKMEDEFIQLPNLGPYLTFNSQIVLYAAQPNSKRWTLQAIKQSIFDIIGPVVERSVAIASVSTRELILKDFAMESDENKMRKAAHLMARSLAGSLAMVTCKEPLRASMINHLRNTFVSNGLSEVAAEQAAALTASDNLDLVCTVIEKTAMEKVIVEVDEILLNAYASRKKHREQQQQRGNPQPYFDMDIFSVSRFPATLPEPLRPKPNGIHANQLRIYEDFLRVPRLVPQAPAGQMQQVSAHQILERFAQYISDLEKLISVTNVPSFGHLPLQHDIITIIHQIPLLALSSFDKAEAARTFAQKVVQLLYKSETQLGREVYVVLLERLCEVSPNVGVLVTSWLTHADDERKYNVPVTVALIKANLINLPEQDQELATLIDSGRMSAIDFTARLIRACLYEEGGLATRQDFMASLEALSRLRGNVPESVLFLMEEMRRRSVPGSTAAPVTLQQHPMLPQGLSDEEIAIREQMHVLFSEWIRLYQHPTSTDKILKVFVTQLSQQNIFKMEDMSSLFYRTCIEASVEHAIKHKQLLNQPVGLTYLPIDALSKLIVCLMELPQPPVDNSAIGKAAMDSPDSARIALFTKILSIVILVISQMHDQRQQQFDQRPFLRFFTSLLCELHSSEQQLQTVYMSILSALSNTFNTLQPLNFPGFTFAWLQLTSHRMFMPKLLLAENQKGWPIFQQLLISLFKFLNPFLHKAKLKDTTRMLYRGTLRVLLVLLHDFPEFLCDYHYSLCDVIPSSCIQLRNLILSAFPRHMRLPDPFTPNLKVDLLPDINQSPNILSDYTSILKKSNLKQEIDDYMKSQIDKAKFLASLPSKLMLAKDEQEDSKYNVSMMNALVFYVGVTGVTEGIPVNQGAPIQIFQYLLNELDSEGRYLFLSATANQLRYPNSHTHYFSCVILYLFAESTKEIVKEQITRVLLERLIVNRPHPWGLLITFIELIKNPRYSFWNHSFTRCATDIERLFESVSRSINQT
ncbi:hypothetical protein CU097_012135 [Rhizopus azygosporus]|uniref:General negative regulator of transcription subunit 1 n=1 Tax=Rhizopus azygosporus TaxID=86630 RepID=A0A367K691_RHIAZ|nr:hypothetical protein CU097_012135 [Rhizopus azygosporus]